VNDAWIYFFLSQNPHLGIMPMMAFSLNSTHENNFLLAFNIGHDWLRKASAFLNPYDLVGLSH